MERGEAAKASVKVEMNDNNGRCEKPVAYKCI
jgi:hypothetical protein